ncbi:alanine racemase, partial [Lysobacter capsici]|uniref:alanine racemase n=1 Tax=Lysobacter capsici TaxID=435897 RepID=UPI00398D0E08
MQRAAHDAGRPVPRLLAVSKTQGETAVANLALMGQTAFGENYVQEAAAKHAALAGTAAAGLALEWHLIGHLQSNKAAQAAALFDWVQTVDRAKLVAALARHRDPQAAPLNVLIQVNIDDEASKHGCRPEDAPAAFADSRFPIADCRF